MHCCPRCTHPAYATDRFCLNCGQALHRADGRRWLTGGLLLLLCAIGGWTGTAAGLVAGAIPRGHAAPVASATPAPCRFVLGFKTLHDLMPTCVGTCRDNEHYQPASGETIQHTSGGLLVWRKADNGTAFTDGSKTWLLGPAGLQQRPNNRRFPWEANPQHLPVLP